MKRTICILLVIVLTIGSDVIAFASTSFTPSIFEPPSYVDLLNDSYVTFDCMCSDYLTLGHYQKNGITFFLGSGERMPANEENHGCCLTPPIPTNIAIEIVVFFDGVPNLSKDLFKWCEGLTRNVYIPVSVVEIDEDCFVMSSEITVHFPSQNEVALSYAQNRNMRFEVMDGQRILGDVDYNKQIDMKDVLVLRKSIANLPASYEIYSTDINSDNSTDMKDVLALRTNLLTE